MNDKKRDDHVPGEVEEEPSDSECSYSRQPGSLPTCIRTVIP